MLIGKTLAPINGKTIVVGDTHGCVGELKDLLKEAGFVLGRDQVVLVGDLIEKPKEEGEPPVSRPGYPSSTAALINFAIGLCSQSAEIGGVQAVHAVLGNHDLAVLAAAKRWQGDGRARATQEANFQPHQKTYGHQMWVARKVLNDAQLKWLADLPFFIEIPQYDGVVVHAALEHGVQLPEQDPEIMVTRRKMPKTGRPWAQVYSEKAASDDSPRVFFGHDSERGLQVYPEVPGLETFGPGSTLRLNWSETKAVGLDTGCAKGGQLTAAVLWTEGKRRQLELVSVASQQPLPKEKPRT